MTNLNLYSSKKKKNDFSRETRFEEKEYYEISNEFPLPQSLQILVHGHLFHVINVLHLIISRCQIIGEAVIATGHVHHRSSVAPHNLITVRPDVLHLRERGGRDVAGFVAAHLIPLGYLPVTIVRQSRIQIVPEIG